MKKLKDNVSPFTVKSGKFAGRRFERGARYPDSEIPAELKNRFVTVGPKKGGKSAKKTKE